MKGYMIFSASSPIVILTSHPSVTHPSLLEKLSGKGLDKFIAYEISLDMLHERYGLHFDITMQDLHETDDLRVLDYNGNRALGLIGFGELGEPIKYEAHVSVV